MVPSTIVELKTLTTHRGAVMVEREERFVIEGKPIDHEVVGVLMSMTTDELTRWRDYYDLTSLVDRFVATTTPSI
ncbi:MAG TPA: limonene-1,2-epoxide hydrolase family protein [Mycobacterium sp.]|nr:limonene-1,2-epoxide hydrolase family protein [Mycobacterium sp.]